MCSDKGETLEYQTPCQYQAGKCECKRLTLCYGMQMEGSAVLQILSHDLRTTQKRDVTLDA